MTATAGLDTAVAAVLAGAGVDAPPTRLVPVSGGDDNRLYRTTAGGRDLLVKVAAGQPVRFAIAGWAAGQFAGVGVPVPRMLGHTEDLSVETRCPGVPLDELAAGSDPAVPVAAAHAAGRLLRRIHTITVRGAGRLTTDGVGPHATVRAWLLAEPPTCPHLTVGDRALLLRTRHALAAVALVPQPPLRLLHGDWVSRHVIVNGGAITGIVDLQSVRGGDPLADLAGWSLQEPARLTRALSAGYDLDPSDPRTRLALTLYRLRIASALLRYHAIRGDHRAAALRRRQLRGDLADLDAGHPRAMPRRTPSTATRRGTR